MKKYMMIQSINCGKVLLEIIEIKWNKVNKERLMMVEILLNYQLINFRIRNLEMLFTLMKILVINLLFIKSCLLIIWKVLMWLVKVQIIEMLSCWYHQEMLMFWFLKWILEVKMVFHYRMELQMKNWFIRILRIIWEINNCYKIWEEFNQCLVKRENFCQDKINNKKWIKCTKKINN